MSNPIEVVKLPELEHVTVDDATQAERDEAEFEASLIDEEELRGVLEQEMTVTQIRERQLLASLTDNSSLTALRQYVQPCSEHLRYAQGSQEDEHECWICRMVRLDAGVAQANHALIVKQAENSSLLSSIDGMKEELAACQKERSELMRTNGWIVDKRALRLFQDRAASAESELAGVQKERDELARLHAAALIELKAVFAERDAAFGARWAAEAERDALRAALEAKIGPQQPLQPKP